MPTYSFRNKDTGKKFELFLSISEREVYLKENPNIQQTVSSPAIISGRPRKPDEGFRDLLREIKKKNSRGFTRSNINTF